MADPKLIKQLRELTGAGILECKEALEKNNWEVQGSVQWLRKRGTIKATKKLSRVSNDGVISLAENIENKSVLLLEIKTETDFVARNDKFHNLASKVSQSLLNWDEKSNVEEHKVTQDLSVKDILIEGIATIGEKIALGKIRKFQAMENEIIGIYLHNSVGKGLAKIGAMVKIKSQSTNIDILKELANKLSVHIAANSPLCISPEHIPTEILEKERSIFLEQDFGNKPANIIDKIIENKVNEFKNSISLLKQGYVFEQKKTVEDILEETSKVLGTKIAVLDFVRLAVGE
ncbi:translation elongation factor Ts [Candidatus Sneabacter namystus]|uniref:Elongation factor Ts n=1 Tax=Candidatus Sneabacter namystus TaxID=2601646 RepID=A0A5C0UKZ1_9RICK|nr:translation elongation factor Ts [Candidatus Sneabacter namystus]QEK39524.1 translation elongation factor Ts [Candidatus Sneabacter namystus]